MAELFQADSPTIRLLETRFRQITGEDARFWATFVEPLSKGWELRSRDPTSPLKPSPTIEFWVKRVKCKGDEASRELVGSMVAGFFKLQEKPIPKRYSLLPTECQINQLTGWFNHRKSLYNSAVNWIQSKSFEITRESLKDKFDEMYLKGKTVSKRGKAKHSLIDTTITELLIDYENAIGEGIDLSVVNKAADQVSMIVAPSMWGEDGILFRSIKCNERLPEKLPNDSRLVFEKPDKYYLDVSPTITEGTSEKSCKLGSYVFVNPGTLNFATCIGSDGQLITIGGEAFKEVKKMEEKRAKMKDPAKTRCLERDLKSLIFELDEKVSKYLCDHYDHIFLPKLENCQSTKSNPSRIMCEPVHFRFIGRLRNKAAKYRQCTTITMVDYCQFPVTCSNCGYIGKVDNEVETFSCSGCGLKCSTEENEAKNVMIRFLIPHLGKVVEDVLSEYENTDLAEVSKISQHNGS